MLYGIAILWSFAEATLFFIVPDVFLTYLVIFNVKAAYWSCLLSLIGAMIGGACMYLWGAKNYSLAARTIATLPGISNKLIVKEKENLLRTKLWAILLGPLKGIPYKIYAILAPSSGISILQFLGVSIPARLPRFILSVVVTDLVFHNFLMNLTLGLKIAILTAFWLIFYIAYFIKMR